MERSFLRARMKSLEVDDNEYKALLLIKRFTELPVKTSKKQDIITLF
jgi:hypothetical protein